MIGLDISDMKTLHLGNNVALHLSLKSSGSGQDEAPADASTAGSSGILTRKAGIRIPFVLNVREAAGDELPLYDVGRNCNNEAYVTARKMKAHQLVGDCFEEGVPSRPRAVELGGADFVQSVAVLLHELFDERDRIGVTCRHAFVASVPVDTDGTDGQKERFIRDEVLGVRAADEGIRSHVFEDGPNGARNDVRDDVVWIHALAAPAQFGVALGGVLENDRSAHVRDYEEENILDQCRHFGLGHGAKD